MRIRRFGPLVTLALFVAAAQVGAIAQETRSGGPEENPAAAENSGAAPAGVNDNDLSIGATVYLTRTPSSIGYEIPVNYIDGVVATGNATDNNYDSIITVEYKKAADATYIQATDAVRIADLPESINNTEPRQFDHFAGAIWGLEPGTTYNVRFTVNDPDGYNEIRTDTASTAPAPITLGTPTHTIDGTDTLDDLRELLDGDGTGDAAPGDVILIDKNLANDGADYMIDIGVSGASAASPIGIRCSSRGIVIDGKADAKRVLSIGPGVDHVYIENCTITTSHPNGYVIRSWTSGGNDGIVIRQNLLRITGVWVDDNSGGGIRMDGSEAEPNSGTYIEDNFLEGRNSFPYRRTGRDEGIRISGTGLTVAHNYLRGWGDSIGFYTGSDFAINHVVIYGNDVWWSKDDSVEGDGAQMLIVHHNRFMNYNSCISGQPPQAGPYYFVRNICWSGKATKHFKFDGGSSGGSGRRMMGLNVYHNIFGGWWTGSSYKVFNTNMLNNLWVSSGFQADGVTPSGFGSVDTATSFLGKNNGNDADQPPPQEGPNWDYNRYNHCADCSFRVGGGYQGSTFASYQSDGLDAHSEIIGEPIFTTDQQPYPTANEGNSGVIGFEQWVFLSDGRPHPSSTLIDTGIAIRGINEANHPRHPSTNAPDIGLHEAGSSLYPYGLLTWSYTATHCNDGLDNDWDGDIDSADVGCVNPNDPSELGATDISPECDDGLDNDDDRLYNMADVGDCVSRCDTTEGPATSELCSGGDPDDPPATPEGLSVY